MRRILVLCALAMLIVATAGCVSSNSTPTPASAPTTPYSAPTAAPRPAPTTWWDLENFHWTNGEYGSRYLEGDLTNVGNVDREMISLEFTLYDRQGGSVVGSGWDYLSTLPAGETWHFKSYVFEDRATYARLSDVSGYPA
jgi:hypothetical protein